MFFFVTLSQFMIHRKFKLRNMSHVFSCVLALASVFVALCVQNTFLSQQVHPLVTRTLGLVCLRNAPRVVHFLPLHFLEANLSALHPVEALCALCIDDTVKRRTETQERGV